MSPELAEGVRLAVVGIVTVFLALTVTAFCVTVIMRFTRPRPLAAKPSLLPEVAPGGRLDRRTLVLLAAAASVAVKRPVRIRRVRFVARKQIPTSWAAAGRSDHVHETLD